MSPVGSATAAPWGVGVDTGADADAGEHDQQDDHGGGDIGGGVAEGRHRDEEEGDRPRKETSDVEAGDLVFGKLAVEGLELFEIAPVLRSIGEALEADDAA